MPEILPGEVLYGYTDGSFVQQLVRQLIRDSTEEVERLTARIALHLLTQKPKPAEVATNLIRFWVDLPVPQAGFFYRQQEAVWRRHAQVEKDELVRYLLLLTRAYQDSPLATAWNDVNTRINATHPTDSEQYEQLRAKELARAKEQIEHVQG